MLLSRLLSFALRSVESLLIFFEKACTSAIEASACFRMVLISSMEGCTSTSASLAESFSTFCDVCFKLVSIIGTSFPIIASNCCEVVFRCCEVVAKFSRIVRRAGSDVSELRLAIMLSTLGNMAATVGMSCPTSSSTPCCMSPFIVAPRSRHFAGLGPSSRCSVTPPISEL